jgi:hypothetical protein
MPKRIADVLGGFGIWAALTVLTRSEDLGSLAVRRASE